MAKDTRDINRRQKEFYNTKRKNFATRIWSYFRNGILNKIRKEIGLERQIHQLHKNWLGDISDKKVLDLGCYEGNSLSIYLAEHSGEYLAIDLSEKGISHLKGRIKNIKTAHAIAIDFLSPDFQEKNFDVIYAYGVLHHFRDTDNLIRRLKEKLNPDGIIISNDPLETSIPVKLARSLYRPFQSDKDWEWPFSKKTYRKFEKEFRIKDRRGMLGRAKWLFILNLLPMSKTRKLKLAEKWHQKDWKNSQFSDAELFQCMHLTMLMQNKVQ